MGKALLLVDVMKAGNPYREASTGKYTSGGSGGGGGGSVSGFLKPGDKVRWKSGSDKYAVDEEVTYKGPHPTDAMTHIVERPNGKQVRARESELGAFGPKAKPKAPEKTSGGAHPKVARAGNAAYSDWKRAASEGFVGSLSQRVQEAVSGWPGGVKPIEAYNTVKPALRAKAQAWADKLKTDYKKAPTKAKEDFLNEVINAIDL